MKTVVGMMNNRDEAQLVVQDLVNSGFQRDAISIMASDQEGLGYKEGLGQEDIGYEGEDVSGEGEARAKGAMKGAGTGAAVGGAAGLLVGLTGLAIPGIGPIIAAGPVAALLAGAGVGAVAGGAIGALTKMGVPEEDAHFYAEGVKRGGFLVTVSADDQNADMAADIMRRHGAVDIDEQAETWRQEGWTRFDESAPYAESWQQGSKEVPAAASRQFYEREAMTEANASAEFEERSNVQQKQELEQKEVPYAASSQEFYQRDAGVGESASSQLEREAIPRAAGSMEREGVIPIVQEEVVVGKRQVQTGGVRVYSHITEVPVQEEISLREERATIERRPVDRPVTEAERTAFQEKSFEIRETAEEPVISKMARVKEEVIVGTEASERTELIRETARHTEVEVERVGERLEGQLNTESSMDDEELDRYFSNTYGPRREGFEAYRSAFHYAEAKSCEPQLCDKEWPEVEEVIHQDWERTHPGTWTEVKEAIHLGWDKRRHH